MEKWLKSKWDGTIEPTVISPKAYKERFRTAMWTYFVLVPQKFTRIVDPLRNRIATDVWESALKQECVRRTQIKK